MPAKLDRCVSKVENDGDVDNAYAVCNASIGEAFIANNNYPDMNKEGGVGSGIKGHTTAKDAPKGQGAPAGEPYDDPADADLLSQDFYSLSPEQKKLYNQANERRSDRIIGPNEQKSQPVPDNILDLPPFPDDDFNDPRGYDTVERRKILTDYAQFSVGSNPENKSPEQMTSDLADEFGVPDDYARKFVDQALSGLDYPPDETTEGGMGSGRRKAEPHGKPTPDVPQAVRTPRAKPAMPDTGKKTAFAEKPLTMIETTRMIQEMQAKPMTGSTKKMSGGSKGKAPKHWTPVDFNVLDKAQGQEPVPPPVGRAISEANLCEVCGVPDDNHQDQDHPMIPPINPQENNMPPMPNGIPNGFPPTEPSPQMPPPQPQEQAPPMPPPNGMGMDMPPMPPAQVPPPMPQEQMPLPSPMPPAPQPNMQMQYTVSVPNSLSAKSIGGKKINEMIREVEYYISRK